VGIPICVALALTIGGVYLTDRYLRAYRDSRSPDVALVESTRCHLAYDYAIVALAALVLIATSV
jgi:hypothetical protein